MKEERRNVICQDLEDPEDMVDMAAARVDTAAAREADMEWVDIAAVPEWEATDRLITNRWAVAGDTDILPGEVAAAACCL